MKKLLIIGSGRHGKDTVCEILAEYGYTFVSSSWFCAERVVYPILKNELGYKNVQECYDDRHNHRQIWMDLINAYNQPDLARLTKEITAQYDIYCGLRSYDEFKAAKAQNVFDMVIGVDASERIDYVDPTFEIPMSECDMIIDNNGSYDDLRDQVIKFALGE